MLFPTTPILDTFNRSNEGPPPSASWTDSIFISNSGLKVVSNTCVADSGIGSAWWSAEQFDRNCECYFTIINDVLPHNIYLRLQNPGVDDSQSGYIVQHDSSSEDPRHVFILRLDSGVATVISTIVAAVESDAGFGASAIEGLISAYRKPFGGEWELLGNVIDTTYSSGGYIGSSMSSGGGGIENFGGGDALVSMKLATVLFAGN